MLRCGLYWKSNLLIYSLYSCIISENEIRNLHPTLYSTGKCSHSTLRGAKKLYDFSIGQKVDLIFPTSLREGDDHTPFNPSNQSMTDSSTPSLVWLGLLGKGSVFISSLPHALLLARMTSTSIGKLPWPHSAREKEDLDPRGFPECSLFSAAEESCVVWLLDSVIYQGNLPCWEGVSYVSGFQAVQERLISLSPASVDPLTFSAPQYLFITLA